MGVLRKHKDWTFIEKEKDGPTFFALSGEIKWTEIDIRQKRATFPDKRAEKGMENEMPLMFSLKYGIMRRMSMKLKE